MMIDQEEYYKLLNAGKLDECLKMLSDDLNEYMSKDDEVDEEEDN